MTSRLGTEGTNGVGWGERMVSRRAYLLKGQEGRTGHRTLSPLVHC